jgi:CO/xanthine dehydrogenase Mo-binding subunit
MATGSVSRRTFLKVSAAAGGGLLVSFSLPAKMRGGASAAAAAAPFSPNAFVRIDRDGRVTLTMHQVEMGQGTYTSMSMLIAEELAVDLNRVRLEHAPPDDTRYANPLVGFQMTGGSTSVRSAWEPLRREQSNFHNYRTLRINEVPDIDVHLVESTETPGGIGEPGTSAAATAVCNAIFAATGKRVRKLPVDPAQLRSA